MKIKTRNKHKTNNKTKKNTTFIKNKYLFPPILPNSTFFLKVTDIHTIFFATYGNTNGKPVLFVHGGPGGGTTHNNARFFDPKFYHIILVDQRGCGKSTPLANGVNLPQNTTMDLVSDFEKIRKFLKIQKWMVFGGSWGSTLSLVYAIKFPYVVTELIIRGIFLCSKDEINWLYDPKGAKHFNPGEYGWDLFRNTLPYTNKFNDEHINYVHKYHQCFSGKYGKKNKEKCMLAWAAWEEANSLLQPLPLKTIISEYQKNKKSYISNASIENHYFLNYCFLPKNFFSKTNLKKIYNIPTIIVQGKYDLECTFDNAYNLHLSLPKSKLFVTTAGHSSFDIENTKFLIKATNSFV